MLAEFLQGGKLFFCDTVRLTFSGLDHALFLFFCFCEQLRYRLWFIIFIERDVNQIGFVGGGAFACDGVFCDDLNFSFHGSVPRVRDLGVEDDQVSDADWVAECHGVDGDGDDFALRVAHASKRPRLIHKLHDPSTVDVAVVVRMFGLHQLSQLNFGCADGFGCKVVCHGVFLKLVHVLSLISAVCCVQEFGSIE